MTADDYIRTLALEPHPEGGWYRETYRASEAVPREALPERFTGERPFATAIYFLLTADTFSALHRIRSDEQWHFYAGSGLTVHVLEPDGACRTLRLGSEVTRGESFQAVVPAGCWFGATVDEAHGFALVGCTVAPGFDFADFELGERETLYRLFPRHRSLVTRLTRA
ncbi:MAG: cupin domain-containing protein [Desulfuromonadales bacterium]|nr:cupin domain-containing protein [Desulfuromonadales bacterium]NIR33555.1 cupin domain-containing protein [Desulfuromonadales bacterium]NIS41145.1 cupin domain-containing protein [Desulfuromonadales bacterium]